MQTSYNSFCDGLERRDDSCLAAARLTLFRQQPLLPPWSKYLRALCIVLQRLKCSLTYGRAGARNTTRSRSPESREGDGDLSRGTPFKVSRGHNAHAENMKR